MQILSKLKFIESKLIVYIFTEGLVKGIMFLVVPILTRLLTKEDFGIWSLYITALPVVSVFFDLAQRFSVKRYYLDHAEETKKHISSIIAFVIVSLSLTVAIIYGTDWAYISKPFTYMLIFAGTALAVTEVYLAYLQISSQAKLYNLMYGIRTTLPYILALPLIYWMSGGYESFVYVQLAILSVFILYIVYVLRHFLPTSSEVYHHLRVSIKFGISVIPAVLSAFVLNASDRFMIKFFHGSVPVANYSVAYTVASIFLMIILAINKYWQPFILENLKAKNFTKLTKAARLYTICMLALIAVLVLLSKWLVVFIGGEAYELASGIVPTILLGVFFYFIYTLYTNIAFYYKDMFWFSFPVILAAVVNLLLNYFLLQIYSYEIAATTTLISYFVEALIIVIVSVRKYRIALFF